MNPSKETLLLRGVVSMMDNESRQKVEECAGLLRGIAAQYGEFAYIALTMVVSEETDKLSEEKNKRG